MDPHVAREGARARTVVDRLASHRNGRHVDRVHVEARLRGLVPDRRGSHVGGADDLLLLEAVGDGRAAAEAHDDGHDAKRDQHGAGSEAAPLEELPEQVALLALGGCCPIVSCDGAHASSNPCGGSGIGLSQAGVGSAAIRDEPPSCGNDPPRACGFPADANI